jgi:hypothetical protein
MYLASTIKPEGTNQSHPSSDTIPWLLSQPNHELKWNEPLQTSPEQQ